MEHLHILKIGKEFESVTKNLPTKKSPSSGCFPGEFYPIVKEFMLIVKLGRLKRREQFLLIIQSQHYSCTKVR